MEWNMSIIWLIIAVATAAVEAVTVQLVSIWFSAGALAACIASLITDSVMIQVIVFIVVTVITLLITRPIVKKLKMKDIERTNADKYIGQSGIVTKDIDNESAAGLVRVGASVWSAKAFDGAFIPKETKVKVLDIEGVKLIVAPEE